MPDDFSNPETGEMSMESALAHLIQPEGAKDEDAEEAPQEAQPSEVESEEPEGVADEDDADEEGVEAEEEVEAEPRMYTVKIDGQDVEVNEQELLSGYQRDADYRRKTQEIGDSRRALEAEMAKVEQMRAQYENHLRQVASEQEQEPDWVAMAAEDPLGYVEAKAKWDANKQAREQAREQLRATEEQRFEKAVNECALSLVQSIPGWDKPETRQAEYKAMVEVAESFGFSAQEVSMATDPRIHKMVHALMRARTKPARPKPKPPPKTLPAGARPSKSDLKDADRALREKFAKTGSDEDGIAYLLGG